MDMHNPVHPGVILAQWLEGVSVTDAAEKLGVTRLSLSKVLNQRGGISADMDLRLSKGLGTSAGFWYAMQGQYDMWQAKRRFKPSKVKVISRPHLTVTTP